MGFHTALFLVLVAVTFSPAMSAKVGYAKGLRRKTKKRAGAKENVQKPLTDASGHKPFHVVYNAESSSYFAWQARTSWNTFSKVMGDKPYAR
jgi:hypothetical protein